MSRVHTGEHFLNIFHKDDFHFGPSKMTRSKGPNPDYRKAATLSSWLFLKYDVSYKTYRRKSAQRRQERQTPDGVAQTTKFRISNK